MSFILNIAVDCSHQSSKSTDTTKGDFGMYTAKNNERKECLIFLFVCKLVIHFYAYNMLIASAASSND